VANRYYSALERLNRGGSNSSQVIRVGNIGVGQDDGKTNVPQINNETYKEYSDQYHGVPGRGFRTVFTSEPSYNNKDERDRAHQEASYSQNYTTPTQSIVYDGMVRNDKTDISSNTRKKIRHESSQEHPPTGFPAYFTRSASAGTMLSHAFLRGKEDDFRPILSGLNFYQRGGEVKTEDELNVNAIKLKIQGNTWAVSKEDLAKEILFRANREGVNISAIEPFKVQGSGWARNLPLVKNIEWFNNKPRSYWMPLERIMGLDGTKEMTSHEVAHMIQIMSGLQTPDILTRNEGFSTLAQRNENLRPLEYLRKDFELFAAHGRPTGVSQIMNLSYKEVEKLIAQSQSDIPGQTPTFDGVIYGTPSTILNTMGHVVQRDLKYDNAGSIRYIKDLYIRHNKGDKQATYDINKLYDEVQRIINDPEQHKFYERKLEGWQKGGLVQHYASGGEVGERKFKSFVNEELAALNPKTEIDTQQERLRELMKQKDAILAQQQPGESIEEWTARYRASSDAVEEARKQLKELERSKSAQDKKAYQQRRDVYWDKVAEERKQQEELERQQREAEIDAWTKRQRNSAASKIANVITFGGRWRNKSRDNWEAKAADLSAAVITTATDPIFVPDLVMGLDEETKDYIRNIMAGLPTNTPYDLSQPISKQDPWSWIVWRRFRDIFYPQRFNQGGKVPGIGDKDTIPAMLTPYEFVVRAPVAKKYSNFLTAINNGIDVPNVKDGMGYASWGGMMGGFDNMYIRNAAVMANEGNVASLNHPVGQYYANLDDKDQARFRRAVEKEQKRISAGRPPKRSWVDFWEMSLGGLETGMQVTAHTASNLAGGAVEGLAGTVEMAGGVLGSTGAGIAGLTSAIWEGENIEDIFGNFVSGFGEQWRNQEPGWIANEIRTMRKLGTDLALSKGQGYVDKWNTLMDTLEAAGGDLDAADRMLATAQTGRLANKIGEHAAGWVDFGTELSGSFMGGAAVGNIARAGVQGFRAAGAATPLFPVTTAERIREGLTAAQQAAWSGQSGVSATAAAIQNIPSGLSSASQVTWQAVRHPIQTARSIPGAVGRVPWAQGADEVAQQLLLTRQTGYAGSIVPIVSASGLIDREASLYQDAMRNEQQKRSEVIVPQEISADAQVASEYVPEQHGLQTTPQGTVPGRTPSRNVTVQSIQERHEKELFALRQRHDKELNAKWPGYWQLEQDPEWQWSQDEQRQQYMLYTYHQKQELDLWNKHQQELEQYAQGEQLLREIVMETARRAVIRQERGYKFRLLSGDTSAVVGQDTLRIAQYNPDVANIVQQITDSFQQEQIKIHEAEQASHVLTISERERSSLMRKTRDEISQTYDKERRQLWQDLEKAKSVTKKDRKAASDRSSLLPEHPHGAVSAVFGNAAGFVGRMLGDYQNKMVEPPRNRPNLLRPISYSDYLPEGVTMIDATQEQRKAAGDKANQEMKKRHDQWIKARVAYESGKQYSRLPASWFQPQAWKDEIYERGTLDITDKEIEKLEDQYSESLLKQDAFDLWRKFTPEEKSQARQFKRGNISYDDLSSSLKSWADAEQQGDAKSNELHHQLELARRRMTPEEYKEFQLRESGKERAAEYRAKKQDHIIDFGDPALQKTIRQRMEEGTKTDVEYKYSGISSDQPTFFDEMRKQPGILGSALRGAISLVGGKGIEGVLDAGDLVRIEHESKYTKEEIDEHLKGLSGKRVNVGPGSDALSVIGDFGKKLPEDMWNRLAYDRSRETEQMLADMGQLKALEGQGLRGKATALGKEFWHWAEGAPIGEISTQEMTYQEWKEKQGRTTGGLYKGGPVYRSFGGEVGNRYNISNPDMSFFKPRGTDTVPAVLSNGEFVVNARSAQKHLPILQHINEGRSLETYQPIYRQKGGTVGYYQHGGTAMSAAPIIDWSEPLDRMSSVFNNALDGFESIGNNFTQSVDSFASSVGSFAQAAKSIPHTIEMEGRHDVQVTINGAAVLQELVPSIRGMITEEISKQFAGRQGINKNSGYANPS